MGRSFSLLARGIGAMVLATAAIAAGCGGDDDDPITSVEDGASGATGAATTIDAFIDQADAICAESNAAVANLTSDEAADAASEELTITEGQVDSLRSLGDPPEDPETWDQFLSAMDDLVAALEKQELAAQRGEDTAEAASEAATARTESESAAEDFGLKDCGKEGEAIDSGAAQGGDAGTAPTAPSAPAPATPTAPAPAAPAPAAPAAPAPAAPAPAPAPGGGTAPPAPGGGGGGGSGGVSP